MTSDVRYRQGSTLYYPPRRDESIIPILCTTDGYRTSTPVKMRILIKRPPHSTIVRHDLPESDPRLVRHPSRRVLPPPPRTSFYYSSSRLPQHIYHDPYRVLPSYWRTLIPNVSSYRLKRAEHRLLSERLWEMDTSDDVDDQLSTKKDTLYHIRPDYGHCVMSYIDDDDDDDEEEDSSEQQFLSS